MLSESGTFLRTTKVDSIREDKNKETPKKKMTPTKKESSKKNRSYLINAESSKVANRKAQQIFMNIINPINSKEYLKLNLKYLTHGHLDDIVEERTISDVCGYPLCTNQWKDEFSRRDYIIRRNRVYDIKIRRLFCSNKCFQAFEIIKFQVPKTPLYLRSMNDAEFRNLQIYFPDLNKLTGKFGNIVNLGVSGGDNIFVNDNVGKSDYWDDNAEIVNNLVAKNEEVSQADEESNEITSNKTSDCIGIEEISKKLANVYIDSNNVRQDGKKAHPSNANNDRNNTIHQFESAKKVEQRLREMMTFETLKLILGENYLRGMLEHYGKSYDDYNDDKGMHINLEAEFRYITLCSKLDKEDVEAEITENDDAEATEDMPDYEQLKKDVKDRTIKVKSFLVGQGEHEDTPKESEEESEEELSLPLIDSYSQATWRRKIFFDKLYKYLPHHIKQLDLNEKQIVNIMKPVIYTLELSPHNIYFTPPQWSLVCLTFLKMLAIRYVAVADSFMVENGRIHLEHVMLLFGLDNMYLDRLLPYLTEINYILEKCIPNLSKEAVL